MTNKRMPNFGEEVIGWWITHEDYHPNLRYGCNICGNLTKERVPYCPCCKSKMEVNDGQRRIQKEERQ